jgi:hypothetical protein
MKDAIQQKSIKTTGQEFRLPRVYGLYFPLYQLKSRDCRRGIELLSQACPI